MPPGSSLESAGLRRFRAFSSEPNHPSLQGLPPKLLGFAVSRLPHETLAPKPCTPAPRPCNPDAKPCEPSLQLRLAAYLLAQDSKVQPMGVLRGTMGLPRMTHLALASLLTVFFNSADSSKPSPPCLQELPTKVLGSLVSTSFRRSPAIPASIDCPPSC